MEQGQNIKKEKNNVIYVGSLDKVSAISWMWTSHKLQYMSEF